LQEEGEGVKRHRSPHREGLAVRASIGKCSRAGVRFGGEEQRSSMTTLREDGKVTEEIRRPTERENFPVVGKEKVRLD